MNKNTENIVNEHMFKEIFESEKVIKKLTQIYLKDNLISINLPENIKEICFIGSGSSYNCAKIVTKYCQLNGFIDCKCYYSGEFICQNDKSTLYVFISQSGETNDTIEALKKVNTSNTLCVTNIVDSSLWKMTKYHINVNANPEIAIASTKCFIGQLFSLFLLIFKLTKNYKIKNDYIDLCNLGVILKTYFKKYHNYKKKLKSISKIITNYKHIIILGSSIDNEIAQEGSLKICETSYIPCINFPYTEFLHGHMAILNNKSPILCLVNYEDIKKISSIITYLKGKYDCEFLFLQTDYKYHKIYDIFIKIIIFQFISYYCAKELNYPVDKPKGLNKIVK